MAVSIGSFGEDKRRFQGAFDPDTYAHYYAKQNGITIVEARYELRTKYGAPACFGAKAGENSQKSQNSEFQTQAEIKNPNKLEKQLRNIITFLDSKNNGTEDARSLTNRGIYM